MPGTVSSSRAARARCTGQGPGFPIQFPPTRGPIPPKGDNCLISADGTVKLADFGCSKKVERQTSTFAELAKSSSGGLHTMVGTPFWMAPEVISASSESQYNKESERKRH
eukprot:gene45741-biopygen78711